MGCGSALFVEVSSPGLKALEQRSRAFQNLHGKLLLFKDSEDGSIRTHFPGFKLTIR